MIFTLLQATNALLPAIETALHTVLAPMNLFYILLATLFGLVMGVVPGLGGFITLALLIAITFNMSGDIALMIMSAALGGVNFGGSITAILINTPGTTGNLATLLDGHPMAKDGRANEALAASAVSSACGALIGIILTMLFIPFMIPFVLAFNPVDIFWVGILGIGLIAVVSSGDVLLDLISGAFGMLLAYHGLSTVTGGTRFTWGISYLAGGISLIPFALGLFAITEAIRLGSRDDVIAERAEIEGNWLKGVKGVISRPVLFLQSAVIGWAIGIIPGVGGTVANFVAYYRGMRLYASTKADDFGSGIIEGVISPEAANDAKDGGSLLPTLGLGIPGSGSTAILLGAFVLHGLTPGPLLFQQNLSIVFVILFSLVISNVITSTVGLLSLKYLAKITLIPPALFAPTVVAFTLTGVFVVRNNITDLLVAVLFGVIGFIMVSIDMSRITAVIGFILAPIVENKFHQALQLARSEYIQLLYSPVLIIAVILLLGTLLLSKVRTEYA